MRRVEASPTRFSASRVLSLLLVASSAVPVGAPVRLDPLSMSGPVVLLHGDFPAIIFSSKYGNCALTVTADETGKPQLAVDCESPWANVTIARMAAQSTTRVIA